MQLIKSLSLYIFLGLLAYMPLHIFLSTWLGTSFGVLDFAKGAKDVVMVFGFGLALAASYKHAWFKELLKTKLLLAIVLYALVNVVLAVVRPTDTDAEILAVVYNLRFLVFLVYGMLLANLFNGVDLRRNAIKIVLGVGSFVLFFAVVQYTLIPDDALAHFGYTRENGVLPAFFIDDKPNLERVMSTLRDPNSFGSYTIIIGMLAASIWLYAKNRGKKMASAGIFILSLLSLWFSFSRSAWIGFIVGLMALAFIYLKQGKLPNKIKIIGVAAATALLIIGAGIYAFRNTYFLQNVIFHADESTVLEDPNQLRTRFARESIEETLDNPLGHGPGTAGLASIHNDVQGTVLNENYYLQIAYEVGLLGLAVFAAILFSIGRRLYLTSSRSTLALGLFAGLIGLVVTNLFVHIWTNEATAFTWWGLAGIATVLTKSRKAKV